MYSTNGDFGQVRIGILPTLHNQNLFSLHQVGWHKCNEQYRISRPYGCDSHLMLFTLRGNGYLRMNGCQHTLSAGTIAFIPRNIPCWYGTPAGGLWEFYWIHPAGCVATGFLDEVAQRNIFLTKFKAGYSYERCFERILSLCSQWENDAALHISCQLSELFHHVALQICEHTQTVSLSGRAVQIIEKHFAEKITVNEIAGRSFVSSSHLIRIFKQEMGCTPHEYLMEYRLNIAAQLLEFSHQRVESIAQQTGFSSPSHLISSFRQRYGCTPLQYREMTSNGEE